MPTTEEDAMKALEKQFMNLQAPSNLSGRLTMQSFGNLRAEVFARVFFSSNVSEIAKSIQGTHNV